MCGSSGPTSDFPVRCNFPGDNSGKRYLCCSSVGCGNLYAGNLPSRCKVIGNTPPLSGDQNSRCKHGGSLYSLPCERGPLKEEATTTYPPPAPSKSHPPRRATPSILPSHTSPAGGKKPSPSRSHKPTPSPSSPPSGDPLTRSQSPQIPPEGTLLIPPLQKQKPQPPSTPCRMNPQCLSQPHP